MKAKVIRGSGFEGVLKYVYDTGPNSKGLKQAEKVGGNIISNDVAGALKMLLSTQKIRPEIEKPVWHCSLSLPAGEIIDDLKWCKVAESFMQKLGFTESHLYTVVRHKDTEFDHIHIVASRIGLDGTLWLGQWEALKAIRITQELEKKFKLTKTKGLDKKKPEKKQLTSKEIRVEKRTGNIAPKVKLQNLLDDVLTLKPSIAEFCKLLTLNGVEVRANLASTKRMNGFSFSLDGISFKGSSLGKAYTWAGLQRRGLAYDPDKHYEELKSFSVMSEVKETDTNDQNNQSVKQPLPVKDEAVVEAKPDEIVKKIVKGIKYIIGKNKTQLANLPEKEEITLKERLKGIIDKIISVKQTVISFCVSLEEKGVKVLASFAKKVGLKSFSYIIDDVSFQDASLGKAYTVCGLKKRGLSYDRSMDNELQRFKETDTSSKRIVDGIGGEFDKFEHEHAISGKAIDGDQQKFDRPAEEDRGKGSRVDRYRTEQRRDYNQSCQFDGRFQHGVKELPTGIDTNNRRYNYGSQEGKKPSSSTMEKTFGNSYSASSDIFNPQLGTTPHESGEKDTAIFISDFLKKIKKKREDDERMAKREEQQAAELLRLKKQEQERAAAQAAKDLAIKQQQEKEEKLTADRSKWIRNFEKKEMEFSCFIKPSKDIPLLTPNVEFNNRKDFGDSADLTVLLDEKKAYCFSGENIEANLTLNPNQIVPLDIEDSTILAMLRLSKERWPDEQFSLGGDEKFKESVLIIASTSELNIEFSKDSYPVPKQEMTAVQEVENDKKPEQSQVSSRPKGMGR
jgi:hypothetical protein